jgi:hypothetical protein
MMNTRGKGKPTSTTGAISNTNTSNILDNQDPTHQPGTMEETTASNNTNTNSTLDNQAPTNQPDSNNQANLSIAGSTQPNVRIFEAILLLLSFTTASIAN